MKKKTSDFSKQRNILNFRPDIHFVEPPQVEEDKVASTPTVASLDQSKTDVNNLIDNYTQVIEDADSIQEEINKRAANISIKLDPLHDGHILQSVQRHFGDPNKTEITYQEYLDCLAEVNKAGAAQMPSVDQSDILASATDQYRDVFGSLGLPSGLGRPELSVDAQIIKPIDTSKFKSEQLETLFKLLTPNITDLIVKQIAKAGL